jgi:hypothetical protein
VIDFSITVSREQLRPNYGDGFKGGPLMTIPISQRLLDVTEGVNHNEQTIGNATEVEGAADI